MNVRDYLRGKKERLSQETSRIKNFSVFDFAYIPSQPIMRDEAKTIIDALLRYDHTGIPKNLAIVGSRGSGKTLMLRYLARELETETNLTIRYVNVRNHNTSFKILAYMLRAQARGASFDELFMRFRRVYPEKTVVVLDEVDLISPKDRQMEILYRLSRSTGNYMVILLSNSPRLIHAIDPSAYSTLQPEVFHFQNYDAEQLYAILEARANQGLHEYKKEQLRRIAALTVRNSNSDVRIAIKTLFYTATKQTTNIEQSFERAGRDVIVDVVQSLNDKSLLILESIRHSKSQFVKEIYQEYKQLSQTTGEPPYSYTHFYNNLSYLQSCGLILLVSTKVMRTYTNRSQLLFEPRIAQEAFKQRFG